VRLVIGTASVILMRKGSIIVRMDIPLKVTLARKDAI
jgi:hypothetical protein